MSTLYLDACASHPPFPEVFELLQGISHKVANPSSRHAAGRQARKILEDVRDALAGYLQCTPRELYFTSGGTEGNHLALQALCSDLEPGATVVTSATEHPCQRDAIARLALRGFRIIELPTHPSGKVCLQTLEELAPKASLVSLMHANNETGVLTDLNAVAEVCSRFNVRLHSDCVQSLGKVPIPLHCLDAATFSTHKVGGLSGSGAIYLRKGIPRVGLYGGGNQELQLRVGTENLVGAHSLHAFLNQPERLSLSHISKLRDNFESGLKGLGVELYISGEEVPRIGSISNVRFQDRDGQTLAFQLDLKGIHLSTGAACSSGSTMPSPVLLAMGLSESEAKSALRVSFHCFNKPEDAEFLLKSLQEVL